MNRRWLVQRTNPEYVEYLSRSTSVSPALAQILINRGVKTPQDISTFLSGAHASPADPFSLEGMSGAVEAIEDARRRSLRVLIHGDYDADGLTATAMLSDALRKLGLDVTCFIPNRFRDGYGFNPPAVEMAREMKANLIVTVDCGISSFEACREAARAGMRVVVTDHHEPVTEDGKPQLPEALAVINPKVSSPGLSVLSGAGVALKMVQALGGRYPELAPSEFTDLAALGTVADSVPLVGENRLIVREGIEHLEKSARPGIRALRDVAGLSGRSLRSSHLTYTLVPRINAAGRMGDASGVVELLTTSDETRAAELAASLDRMNKERQMVEEAVNKEAVERLESEGVGNAVVLAGEDWHEGVLGIVAARLAERFSRPSFVFSVRNGIAKGSARSIPQFDVFRGLSRTHDILLSYGGHPQAAGLRLDAGKLDEFRRTMERVVTDTVEDFTPTLTIEAAITLKEISFRLLEEFRALEPFGFGNPEPVLGAKGLEVMSARVVGNNHLKMKLRSRSTVMDSIGFGMGALLDTVESAGAADAVFTASVNEWEGGRTIQLALKGIRPA
jgi:single-stranded-DNA-specific exonuclease